MIKETAEKLMGRSLEKNDGLSIEIIEETELLLDIKLPKYLKDFYSKIGNIQLFTKSFNKIIDIDKLYFKDDKLVFLEENQEVCIWGINIYEEDPIVYQNSNDEWYSEEVILSEFLNIIMYYQCAQGYKNVENIDAKNIKEKINKILNEMEKVVDHNHLIIYWKNNVLLWYYTDEENKMQNDSVIILGLTEEKLKTFKNEYGI